MAEDDEKVPDVDLPPAWKSLPKDFFEVEEDFPKVLLSYQSHSTGPGLGKAWMWAVANGLRKAGFTSFNGYQVTGGKKWKREWLGVLPEAKVLVVMLSKSYFSSAACVMELSQACDRAGEDNENPLPIIPIYLEKVDIKGRFLGNHPEKMKSANFIRPFISGNSVPPNDVGTGLFPGKNAEDFKHNMKLLIDAIEKIAPGLRSAAPAHRAAAAAAPAPVKRDRTTPVMAKLSAELASSSLKFNEEVEVDVILSYCTALDDTPGDSRGLILCEGVAQALKRAGIEPFHGRMARGGDNWMRMWYGLMAEAKVGIVMLTPAYFKSQACVNELLKMLENSELGSRVIPLFVAPVDMRVDFLGTTKLTKRDANFVRSKLSGNCIPPPDRGLFQDDWEANLQMLIARVKAML